MHQMLLNSLHNNCLVKLLVLIKGYILKSAIDDWVQTISEMINISYKVGKSVSDHSTILGDARESFIRDILEKFLPSSIVIGSGQVIDQCGGKSKQIDIIIYRREFPVLKTFGSADVYLIEGVIATIEVKSFLDKDNLKTSLDNAKSVKELKPKFVMPSLNYTLYSYFQKSYEDDLTDAELFSFKQMVSPETFVFAYRGQKLATTKKHIEDWFLSCKGAEENSYYLPEAISTNEFAMVKDLDGIVIPKKDSNSMAYRSDECSIRFIVNQLLEQVMRKIGSPMYAKSQLQYDILGYSLTAKGIDDNWEGFLKNKHGVTDLTLRPPPYLDELMRFHLSAPFLND